MEFCRIVVTLTHSEFGMSSGNVLSPISMKLRKAGIWITLRLSIPLGFLGHVSTIIIDAPFTDGLSWPTFWPSLPASSYAYTFFSCWIFPYHLTSQNLYFLLPLEWHSRGDRHPMLFVCLFWWCNAWDITDLMTSLNNYSHQHTKYEA